MGVASILPAFTSAAWILLAIACVGTMSSTVFLLLTLAGVWYHTHKDVGPVISELPPVSVLKPVHGLEPRLKENIESFFQQDYPIYEILFAAADENDPSLEIIREISSRYPHIPSRILVTGQPP